MKRSIAVLAALAGLAVCAPLAAASDATSATGTSSSSSAATSTSTPAGSSSSSTTPAPSTSTPVTTVPATTVTEVPATTVTETPATTTVTETPATTTITPVTTATPGITTPEPCAANCIPESAPVECTTADCIPASAGGAVPIGSGNAVATLPFTGIGDVLAPALLALVVVIGGVVAWRWAQLREAVAAAANRTRDMPRYGAPARRTGYEGAMRQLGIEQRARRVFQPRVA